MPLARAAKPQDAGETRSRGGGATKVYEALKHDILDLVLAPGAGVRGRPYPDLILTALMRLGVDGVGDVAALGDTTSDVTSALRAGCPIAAGTLTGAHGEEQLYDAGATHVVPTVSEFADLILDHQR